MYRMATTPHDVEERFDKDAFCISTLESNWGYVVGQYRTYKEARTIDVGGGRGTALHVAVTVGLKDVVREFIKVVVNDKDDEEVLTKKNEQGDTPLHLAASRGFRDICKLIIGQIYERDYLITMKNKKGETPLFLAALSWQKLAFAYLFDVFRRGNFNHYQILIREEDGDTILHTAIRRELFDLAVIIIEHYPVLNDVNNRKGITPLKLLANRPSAFKSGSNLTWWRRIIYHSTIVEELDAEEKLQWYLTKEEGAVQLAETFPENYLTCYQFFMLWLPYILGLFQRRSKNEGNEERTMSDEHKIGIPPQRPNPETTQLKISYEEPLMPPNYATSSYFAKLVFMFVLGFSGTGIITEISKMKKKHVWSRQLLNALMENPYGSYMGSGTQPLKFEDPMSIDDNQSYDDEKQKNGGLGDKHMEKEIIQQIKEILQQAISDKKTEVDHEEKIDPKETVLLIAAKNGIVEIVREILDKIPSALNDTTTDKMNVFHVAIKNRQPLIVMELLNKLKRQDINNMLIEVDKDDNTVLHLAAEASSEEIPWKIRGSAMQIMWDITWFEYIKSKVPDHFVLTTNKHNKTSGEIFRASHIALLKESSEWLTESLGSYSAVAVLVAGVTFATAGQVPGGTEKGRPILEDKPGFAAFAISSLMALCFSVTALIMFLSILTSRKQAIDFRKSLPLKLLLGLTSLFISITSFLVSFCTGNFFVLKDKYKQYVFPIYIATCLPVSFYAVAQFPLYLQLLYAVLTKVPQPSDNGE